MKHETKTTMNLPASSGGRISFRLSLCFPPNLISLCNPKGNQYCECWAYCYFRFSNSFYYKSTNFYILRFIIWYHCVCGLQLFSLETMFFRFISLLHVAVICSFSWRHNIPLSDYMTIF